ncbi:hypothetical protein KAU09_04485 [Candidatus Parcubacteria bacterium]|nr:hypothetical protein [Candidatus Parcubacteria bacterium]
MLRKQIKKHIRKPKKHLVIRLRYKWDNLNTIAKIIALLLPFSILIYLGVKFYDAQNYNASYSVDFNEENFKNTELPLYINELQNSPKFSYFEETDTGTIAQVEGSPISFVFQPEEFPLNKNITVSMILQGDGEWEISLVCPNCEKEEKYNWQAFYDGKMGDYFLAATFDGVHIYTKEKRDDYISADSIEEWIGLNASPDDSIEIKNEVFPKSKLVNPDIDFHKGEWTTMDKTIRGPHEFFVYLEGGLEMEVIKKDLNNYEGADRVRVALYDLDDNLIEEDFLDDDGIEDASKKFTPVVRKDISFDVPSSGVYKLALDIANPDLINYDWTITNFKINTNKIIFAEKSLILDDAKLYTNNKGILNVGFYAWHGNAVQTIKIKSENIEQDIVIDDIRLGKWQYTDMLSGENIITTKGDQRTDGFNFSIDKNNYFEIYTNTFTNIGTDIIISDTNYTKLANNWLKVDKLFSLKNIEKSDNLKSITFQIRNNELYKQFKNENFLYTKGYSPLAQFNEYKLFGNNELKNTNSLATDLISWLKNSLPSEAILLLPDNIFLNKDDLLPIKIITDNKENFDFALTENIIQNPILFKEIKIDVE